MPKKKSSPICTIPVNSWEQFHELVSGPEYRNWAYRGQQEASWSLTSTLSRYLIDHAVHPKAWPEQEKRILRIFRRKAHLFLDHVPDEIDVFQWLALMQHHGAPTRLLDMTWSPYVAAFFALSNATETSAVWALRVPAIWEVKHRFPPGRKRLSAAEFGLRVEGAYEEYYLKNNVKFVSTGEPFVMNQRLIAQSGTFVVPGVLDLPVDEILGGYPDPERTVVKFEIDTSKVRTEALRALYNMNITDATLFPGLDGMARSLAYELESHWAFDPLTLEVYRGYER